MTDTLSLYTIGFGRPDLLIEQGRLLEKYLTDPHHLTLIDNTPGDEAHAMEMACREVGCGYAHAISPKSLHDEALNFAAAVALNDRYDYIGFLDHDVFPRCPISIIPVLKKVGFFGIGQRHTPTGRRYLWPGLFFFSRAWLAGRPLNFSGIRGTHKRDDGDCGSGNYALFSDEDWRNVYGMEHGYRALREPDGTGLQSWGYEVMGDWIHLTNSSHWMKVPDPDGRDRLAKEIVACL